MARVRRKRGTNDDLVKAAENSLPHITLCQFAMDIDALEAEFWKDAKQQINETNQGKRD